MYNIRGGVMKSHKKFNIPKSIIFTGYNTRAYTAQPIVLIEFYSVGDTICESMCDLCYKYMFFCVLIIVYGVQCCFMVKMAAWIMFGSVVCTHLISCMRR